MFYLLEFHHLTDQEIRWPCRVNLANISNRRSSTQIAKAAFTSIFLYLCPLVSLLIQQQRVLMSLLKKKIKRDLLDVLWHLFFRRRSFTAHVDTIIYLKMLQLTFCLSSIFIAKYCSVPLCFTSMTLPNEPVPSVFNLSKSSRHVVLCGNNIMLVCFASVPNSKFEFSRFLTCGGHSHFRKKSSLALARNSLTKR